jgi:hypothetical protein
VGPGGTLWFPAGNTITELIPGSRPGQLNNIVPYATTILGQGTFITAGLDGHIWYTELQANRIGELTPGSRLGVANITEHSLGLNAYPGGIAVASDGNLWFTEPGLTQIGELIPDRSRPGVVNIISYAAGSPTKGGLGDWITMGPDGNMWYVESGADRIGTMTSIAPTDPLANKFGSLGAVTSFLGAPTSLEQGLSAIPGGRAAGRYQTFERGAIYWSADTGAHEVHGAILGEWAGLGWERSFLGYPTSDETGTAQNGRYNSFQGGFIMWSLASGAHEIHGAILNKYASLGWQNSFLGFPVSDETGTPDGVGRYNHFQNGSIYWTPSTGAHEVHGAIAAEWASLGWERSVLGYPTSDEYNFNGGRRSDFQGGYILWDAQHGVRVFRN